MILALYSMPIRRRRDVILARQRARQIAGLLGFDHDRQVHISSAVFAMAADAIATNRANLTFELRDDVLRVRCREDRQGLDHGSQSRPLPSEEWGTGLPSVVEALPDQSDTPARADLPWLIDELAQHTPLSLFEEFEIQNEELLMLYRHSSAATAAR